MKLNELITELSQYPANAALEDIRVTLKIEKELGRNSIRSAYLADHRITGMKPICGSIHMERMTNLKEVASSLLTGLKLSNIMKGE